MDAVLGLYLLSSNHTRSLRVCNVRYKNNRSDLTVAYYISIYTQLCCNFEESSLINIVENYNHCLAEIGSHGSSLTLYQIPNIFGWEIV